MAGKRATTRQKLQDEIAEMAAKAFGEHKIECRLDQGMYRSWRCAKPGTWVYGFHVHTTPGTLIVTGDIGFLAVERCEDMIAWASGSIHSIDYFAEKVPRGIEVSDFDPGVAKEFLIDLKRDLKNDRELDDESREKIAELMQILDGDEIGDFPTELYKSGLIDGCDMPDLRNYKPQFLWCRQALIWFFSQMEA